MIKDKYTDKGIHRDELIKHLQQEIEFDTKTVAYLSKLPSYIAEAEFKYNNDKGEVKYCPQCKCIRQTGCSACGCGSCTKCGFHWSCVIPPKPHIITLSGKWKWIDSHEPQTIKLSGTWKCVDKESHMYHRDLLKTIQTLVKDIK